LSKISINLTESCNNSQFFSLGFEGWYCHRFLHSSFSPQWVHSLCICNPNSIKY